jgi:HSP20 family protein
MLTRWEPRSDALAMRQAIERMFEEPFGFRFPPMWRLDQFEPVVDMTEDENAYTVKASIPGVKPEDVEVTLQHNILTFKGEMKEEKESTEENYHLRERRYGAFMRNVTLPTEVMAEAIEAKHEDGVLTVRLPKSEISKPKKIAVEVAKSNGK